MAINGHCLCGKIHFLVHKNIQVIYHCHCSLCRKQSGTGANAATLVDEKVFGWCSGTDFISTYKKDSGFTSCFCKSCGSPVPNKVGKSTFIWIPFGLLDEQPTITQRLNFCLNSKSSWAPFISANKEYLELPDWEELENYFQ
ncbi:GFA family protein [Acinetobacter rudis]|uniref:GFA family protein n=1 Tax=Acinetobacter rudis TaxID=632955 RepID=UPI00280EC13E|nr:GFA family protein [Acinetobacter rudis]MDQ8953377.1 GFA family protein [Acinetobacter rudis]